MSDFNSSLPVKTQSAGDVIVKVADATISSQQLTVNADGSIKITDNGGSLTVDAINLDIRDLVSSQDSVEARQATHDSLNGNMTIQVADVDVSNANPVPVSDAGGSLTVDGTVSASNFPATVDTNYGTVGASTPRSAAQIGNATGAANFNAGATGAQTLRVEANQGAAALVASSWPVKVTDGTDTLLVNTDGSINVVVSGEADGTEVVNYTTSAAVAAAASVNHDYTVPGGVTFYGEEAWMSASGKIKAQLLVNGSVIYTGFNSTANPNIRIPLEHLVKAAATQVVRITITNTDNQAQDVYSTLLGVTK
jgi:predicted RNA-binding protein with PIN domain